ncbi:unnamed protein product, partial [Ixodes hexagonus]
QCFPLQETWYSVYRSYENDPAFGGTAKCGKFSSLGPAENGSYPLVIQYGDTSTKVFVTLASSEGYNVKNLQYFQAEGRKYSMALFSFFCPECVVFRNSYISDKACSLLVPESALGKNGTCCDFIFDLLCGTTPKYYTYDESCSK